MLKKMIESLEKPVANIILTSERQNSVPLKLRTRQECPVSPTPTKHCTADPMQLK